MSLPDIKEIDLTKHLHAALSADSNSGKSFPASAHLIEFTNDFFAQNPSSEDIARLNESAKYLPDHFYLVPHAGRVGGSDNMNDVQRKDLHKYAQDALRVFETTLNQHGYAYRGSHIVTVQEAEEFDNRGKIPTPKTIGFSYTPS